MHASGELEGVLAALGSVLTRNDAEAALRADLLHVLTTARRTGGHTRRVERWVTVDASHRRHDVALLDQGREPVPEALARAISGCGGVLHRLDRLDGTLIGRASLLRGLGSGARFVMLHTDQSEVIPLIAFADADDRPPVLVMNHSDHLFWLGVGIADLLICFRPGGADLAVRRRGVLPERLHVLPTPLPDGAIQKVERAEARRALGLGPEEVLLLTVAVGFKYATEPGSSMPRAIEPVLDHHRQAHLIAIGPDWPPGHDRIHSLGRRSDVRRYFAAADIYLDSMPSTSFTSLLEAGNYGLPLVRLTSVTGAAASIFEPSDPGLDRVLIRADDLDAWRTEVEGLITDADARAELGAMTQAAVASVHCGEPWLRELDDLYRRADAVQPTDHQAPATTPPVDEVDRLIVMHHRASGLDTEFIMTVPSHIRSLSARKRAAAGLATLRAVRSDARRFTRRVLRPVGGPILSLGRRLAGSMTAIARRSATP